jgi:hypothetical protein
MAKAKVSQSQPICKSLVVAIDDYPGHANDLPSCVEDSKAMTALLRSAPYGFEEITTYINEQATLANVKAGLNWLFSNPTALTANDRLVLYFSGHGYRTEKDGSLRECLCLHDGFLFDGELMQLTQSLPPGILSIILDCCHAGGMEKNFREVLLTDEKSREPDEIVRIKTWFPEGEAFAEQSALPFKPFGCFPVFGQEFAPEQKSMNPQVNGLLITACRAEQTASASSSQTQGKSAFTYSVLEALKQIGTTAVVSNSQLFEKASAILSSLKFKQIPVLYEPINILGQSFITLQPIPEAKTSAEFFDSSATLTQPTGSQIMSTVKNPTLKLDRPLTEADAKYCSTVLQSCLHLAPAMYQTISAKDFQTNGQEPIADGKFWGIVISGVASAIPSIINAVNGKDFHTASTAPISEEKFWTEVLSSTIGVLPDLISSMGRKKDFEAGIIAPVAPAVEASTPTPVPVISPVPIPVASAPVPALNGAAPAGVDEKFWTALFAGVIPALVGAI